MSRGSAHPMLLKIATNAFVRMDKRCAAFGNYLRIPYATAEQKPRRLDCTTGHHHSAACADDAKVGEAYADCAFGLVKFDALCICSNYDYLPSTRLRKVDGWMRSHPRVNDLQAPPVIPRASKARAIRSSPGDVAVAELNFEFLRKFIPITQKDAPSESAISSLCGKGHIPALMFELPPRKDEFTNWREYERNAYVIGRTIH